MPSNVHTKGLISKEILSKLQPHACLINCARGAVIDQKALTESLMNKKFRAGIDVFEQEPIAQNDPLLKVDKSCSVFSPHVAYKTNEALLRRANISIENLKAFCEGSNTNRVDNI